MTESRNAARNTGFAFAGEIGNLLLVMAFGIVAARHLTVRQFGIFSYATSVVYLLLVFTDLGITSLMVREVARAPELSRRVMPLVLGLRVCLGAVLLAVALAFTFTPWCMSAAVKPLRLMAMLLVLAPAGAYLVLFRARENMLFHAGVQLINRGAMLAALLAAVALHTAIMGVIAAHIIGHIVVLAAIAFLVTKYFEPMRIRFHPGKWRSIAARALPFFAMNCLWEIYNRIDQILIPYLDSVEGNGLYGVAMRVAMLFGIVPNAVSAAVYPYFARRSVESEDPLRRAAIVLYRFLGLLGMGAFVFFGIPAADWLGLFFGAGYRAAAPALLLLMGSIPFVFFFSVNISTLYARDRQNLVLWFTLLSVALDVVLDFVLIPRMGFTGAAVASLATNALFGSLTFIASNRILGRVPVFQLLAAPALSAAAAAACLLLTSHLNFFIRVGMAGVVFAAAAFATRALTREDFSLIRTAIPFANRREKPR